METPKTGGLYNFTREIHIVGTCNEKAYVSLLYYDTSGNWQQTGWWSIGHYEAKNLRLKTRARYVYYYASSDSYTWVSEQSYNPMRYIVSENYEVKNDEHPRGSDKELVRFMRADLDGHGYEYDLEIHCHH